MARAPSIRNLALLNVKRDTCDSSKTSAKVSMTLKGKRWKIFFTCTNPLIYRHISEQSQGEMLIQLAAAPEMPQGLTYMYVCIHICMHRANIFH